MDPKDFSQYQISLRTIIHEDELVHSPCPEYVQKSRSEELCHDIEAFIREACSRHLRVRSTPLPELRTHELQAEIVIMPAEELRTLLGLLSRLQVGQRAGRDPLLPHQMEHTT